MRMNELNGLVLDLGKTSIQKGLKIKTLREAIYFYLRDAIIKQQIKPNERLRENIIAKQFGVSTTPVREAILKLGAEGYINLNAHRNVTVKPISHSELTEVYQVISVLDGFAASLALKKMDKKFIEELQKLTSKMENFYKKEMIEEYLKMNTLFHSLIWKIAGNKYLENILDNIQNQMLRYHKERLSFYSNPGYIKKSVNYHKRMLNAIMKFDSDKIERIFRTHWNISGEISD